MENNLIFDSKGFFIFISRLIRYGTFANCNLYNPQF